MASVGHYVSGFFLQFGISLTWANVLGLLAFVLLISGADDCIPLLICVWHNIVRRETPPPPSLEKLIEGKERRIAIFVPCWKESEVIANMVRHNMAAIRYRNFDFFLGVYPNDDATIEVAEGLAKVFRNVHVALCADPGPTSKADCLNCVYLEMCRWETENRVWFDTIVLHDAEDLVHPDALQLINEERCTYSMVQVPVLPIPTPFHELTHAIYCDEFAEYQTIDMRARQLSGSFIPSNGVGTGFARDILDRLASQRGGRVFDPASLTEDYEIGVYIHGAGCPQLFAPLWCKDKEFLATREYFPRKLGTAIRQRTRWVTGIALQTWERYGWCGSWRTRYWFWRDRKGLVANPLGLLTNVLFVAGVVDLVRSAAQHRPWAFAVSNPLIVTLCLLTLVLQCFRLAVRAVCVGRIFGWSFAAGVPLRVFHANLINCCASVRALWRYGKARMLHRPLVWLKTEHAYPTRDLLEGHRRELPDVLVACGFISETALTAIKAQTADEAEMADYLLSRRLISEDDLCHAISLQSGVPSTQIDVHRVKRHVVRSLPAHIEKRFGVVPFRVEAGRMLVAGTRVPPSTLFEELKSFTRLRIDFQLVTEGNYRQLRSLL